MGNRPLTVVAALAAVALGGCRDGVPPFTPVERPVEGPAYALTFGYGQDADPRWSPAGDTVLYHTTQFGPVPNVPGILLAVPAHGGAAVPVMPDLQRSGGRPFATPAYSPDGVHVAYMDMMSIDVLVACSRLETLPDGSQEPRSCTPLQPVLDSALLRVRRIGELRSVSLDPALTVRFDGPDPARRAGSLDTWEDRFHPFQARYRAEHAFLFRPSWAPDGERITYSDGLSVRIWQVGAATAAQVPGTGDGVSPAWSPDGEWIAYTVLPRADSIVHECNCAVGRESVQAIRTVYVDGPGTLVLVRPDGSERIMLGEGEDPAWSPDGAHIYVRRDDAIVRVPRAGGQAVVIAGTDRGRSPAVSPDGSRLAFSRRKPTQTTTDYDIWVVSLEQ
ncbi:MAG: PD40 domain-containing protein [Gemmatimonadetes bacterium]|nr:PD40 domain-containing protein [Gemmatimonadota bacterium]